MELGADTLNLRFAPPPVNPRETITPVRARAINAAANEALARVGLLGKIGLRVEAGRLTGPNGTYERGVVSILRDRAKGWRHTLDHEIIHALRDSDRWGASHGLFRPEEWRALVRASRADRALRAKVEAAYADRPAMEQAEEMVAEFYADWAAGRAEADGGPLRDALETIRSFLRAAASALRGEGFVDAARVMERIASGEIGGRGPDGPGGGHHSERQARGKDGRFAADREGMPHPSEAGAVKEQREMSDAEERKLVGRILDGAGKLTRHTGRLAASLPGEVRKRGTKEATSHLLTDAMTGGTGGQWSILGLVPGRALFMELGRDLPASRTYLREKDAMDALRNVWQARANDTAVAWRKLLANSTANDALMDIMHESTLAQVDPSGAFVPEATQRHRDLVNDPGTSTQQREWAEEVIARDRRRKEAWDRMRPQFMALPPEYRAMYGKVRDEYGAMADAIEQAVIENVEKSMKAALRQAVDDHAARVQRVEDDGLVGAEREQALAEAKEQLTRAKARAAFNTRAKVAAMRQKFESNRLAGPYFPLTRFGDYFVTLRDKVSGEIASFSRFNTRREQAQWAKQARKDGFDVTEGLLSNRKEVRRAVDPGYVAEIQAMLGDAGVGDVVLDQVWQHFLDTLPDLSLRHNRQHRKGRAGFSRDAFRAFGKQMFHGAHQLARLKHGVTMSEALVQMEKEVPQAKDPVRAGAVANEMNRRHEFTMNPKGHALTQYVSSGAFVWHLAMSPAAATVNVFQTTVIGPVVMGARFLRQGVTGACAELSRAMGDFTRGRGWAERSARLTGQEREAMEIAYARGVVDKSQAHDLAGIGESGVDYSDVRARWMARASWMFHHAERLNREVTFLAAYRMAVKDGAAHDEAIQAAADTTWKVHFDYQASSRPRVMQADLPKVLLTFRNYTINMLWRLFRDSHQALMAENPEDRRIARRQLLGITASMALHAGIRGTWGYGLLMMLAGMFLGGGDDEAEEELKKLLVGPADAEGAAAALRRNVGGMMLNGVPGHLTGLDLTGRIGMANLWFRGSGRIEEGRDAYRSLLEEVAGPAVGTIVGAPFTVTKDLGDGNYWRAIEGAVPKFVRDGMKAARYMREGVMTRKGDDLVPEVSLYQAIAQATGFTPAQIAERYQANSRMMNKQERIVGRRSSIQKAAGNAMMAGRSIPQSVIDSIGEFNAEFPEYPITTETLNQSVASRRRAHERNEFGIQLNEKLNDRIRGEQGAMVYD